MKMSLFLTAAAVAALLTSVHAKPVDLEKRGIFPVIPTAIINSSATLPTATGSATANTSVPIPTQTVSDISKYCDGVGDSVMSGFGSRITEPSQLVMSNPLKEYRLQVMGNLIKAFNPDVKGLSKGTRLFNFCYGRDHLPSSPRQRPLRSLGSKLANQVNYFKDHLIKVNPVAYTDAGDYKLLMLALGFNDLCLGCTGWSQNLIFEADKYEENIRNLLLSIRSNIPKVVVSLVTPFNMSQIEAITSASPYCSVARKVLFIECLCLNAANTRKRMDELAAHYVERAKKVAAEMNALRDPNFAVAFDPGFAGINIAKGTADEFLSQLDCFHPSKTAHDLIAGNIWSNLMLPLSQRGNYDVNKRDIRCPSDASRIRID
ncbi:hypothetical protein BC829DRAFT_380727 [Chytridium lagenaria]|nr:hypothetical protein BC829DRAFT_380727 [Chytridium lagenaria]